MREQKPGRSGCGDGKTAMPPWGWIAILAGCLIGLNAAGFAGEPVESPENEQLDVACCAAIDGRTFTSLGTSGRPKFVELAAELANFDRDARPDGWAVTLLLADDSGQPVAMRSHATFELKPGRVALDQVTLIAGNRSTERWTMPLEFDPDGIARVRLSPRHSTLPFTPESNVPFASTYERQRRNHTSRSQTRARGRKLNLNPYRHPRGSSDGSAGFLSIDRSSDFAGAEYPLYPSFGALSVRVSVPTEGTFESVTVVHLDWPIRNVP